MSVPESRVSTIMTLRVKRHWLRRPKVYRSKSKPQNDRTLIGKVSQRNYNELTVDLLPRKWRADPGQAGKGKRKIGPTVFRKLDATHVLPTGDVCDGISFCDTIVRD